MDLGLQVSPKTSLHDILNDPTIPLWKKNLIIRKRNTNRLLFGNLKYNTTTTSSLSASTPPSTLIRTADDECSGFDDNNCISSSVVEDLNSKEVEDTVQSSFEDFQLNGEHEEVGILAEATVVNDDDDSTLQCSSSDCESTNSSAYEMRLQNDNNINHSSANKKIKVKRIMGEEKVKMKNSTRKLSAPSQSSNRNNDIILMDSEEIKYGPGIVHKLRDRYINITMREAASNSLYNRPPLNSLRRASSLDNILDDTPTRRSYIKNEAAKEAIKTTKKYEPTPLNKQESLKRVRSMETLLNFDGKPAALVNEDIVIIEQSKPSVTTTTRKRTSSGSIPSEDEMPPPDVVRQTRQKFERRSSPGNSSVKPNFKKPALSPKPNLIEKENKRSSKEMMPIPPPLPSKFLPEKKITKLPVRKTSLQQQQTSPRDSNLNSKPTKPISKPSSPPTPTKSNINSKLPKLKSEEKKMDDNNEMKTISKQALENIRQNGISIEITPQSSLGNKSHLPGVPLDNIHAKISTTDNNSSKFIVSENKSETKFNENKPSLDNSPKQVGVIRPITKPAIIEKHQSAVEEKMNFVNNVDTFTTPLLKNTSPPNFARPIINNPVVKPEITKPASPETVLKPTSSELWGSKRHFHDQGSTTTFDFTARKTVPDYIENDGVIHRGSSVSDDTFDGPPSPLRQVEVIGGNVVINGRSNLQKLPKANKLRIQFNDSETSTYEYPSEASLLLDESARSPAALQSMPMGSGSLASYTPSKILMSDETFELGVTRAITLPETSQLNEESSTDDFLKPAEDADTVAWSSETASDLLF